MKNIVKFFLVVATMLGMTPTQAQELTGDTGLACAALLCLSSATRPSECNESLNRYYSISARKFTDTIKKRLEFLQLCPVSQQTPEMAELVSAMANGAGRCDAASLNSQLATYVDGQVVSIGNQLPGYCTAYMTNSYTDLSGAIPKYVGTPQLGGYWVEAADYEAALAKYNAWLQQYLWQQQQQQYAN